MPPLPPTTEVFTCSTVCHHPFGRILTWAVRLSGVFINNDKAMMAMGAKYDVKLTRFVSFVVLVPYFHCTSNRQNSIYAPVTCRTPTGKLKIDATGVDFVTKKDGVTVSVCHWVWCQISEF